MLLNVAIAVAIIGTPILFVVWLMWMDSMCRTKAIKKFKDNVRR